MRFQLFKMFESRTSELTEEEFRKILHTKCLDFVRYPKLLQRSKKLKDTKFSYINPKSFDRAPLKKSDRFTDGVESRHHTLFMDNLPSWKGFPKRSQSIIGLTSEDPRTIFGTHRYLIIPFDGAKFGVAPSSDLWGCQVHITDQRPLMEDLTLSFNDKFSEIFVSNKISDNSYSDMISDLQEQYEEWLKDSFSAFKSVSPDILKINKLFKKFKEGGFKKVEDGFDHFFSPDRFCGTDLDEKKGFSYITWIEKPYGGLSTSFSSDDLYEFWTDSECLLWHIGKTEKGNDIEKAYQSFISDFIINK